MADTLKPRDAGEVEKAVAWALAEARPLEIVAGGSKRALGRPVQADMTLDLSGLSGVTLYEPEELVLSARAGTPLAQINQILSEKGQELAFEPADYGPLLGAQAGMATIGGILAANISGPRRLRAGAARDHFLGFHAVSGRGEAFKSGGRVVKNVTGYDLCKVMAGSFGTLGVMTDVTVKVLPAGEEVRTVLLAGLDAAQAASAMSAAMGSSCDVSAAAHVPAGLARYSAVAALASAGASITALRLEGIGPSVAYRADKLTSLLAPFAAAADLDAAASRTFWAEVRDARYFTQDLARPLWRLSVPPVAGPDVAQRILNAQDGACFFDWAGGLIWLELAPSPDAGAAIVRAALGATGGHATLVRAAPAVRAAVPVFQPQQAAVAALAARLKAGFDPKGILNPGRMAAGI